MALFDTQLESGDWLEKLPLLSTVRSLSNSLPVEEMQFVTEQLILLLEQYYVHLPLKRSSLGINPVQEAKILADEVRFIMSDTDFYHRVFSILKRLRDRHTRVRLPSPWRDMVAFLPFAVESYFDKSGRHLIISKLMDSTLDFSFSVGAEISHWNGVSIGRYIEELSWQTEGANPFARIAIALRSLTVRPLGYMPQPIEDWVTLTYTDRPGIYHSITLPWKIYIPDKMSAAGKANITSTIENVLVQAVDRNALIINNTWYDLYTKASNIPSSGLISPSWESNVQARLIKNDTGEWGYIRIFSFEVTDSAAFVIEVAKLLKKLPKEGVIIDVRANPGGSIPAGEGLIKLFTPRRVSSEPVSFRNTKATRRLGTLSPFAAWNHSMKMHMETGAIFSQGFPLTTEEEPRGVYSGKVVVVVDALCYSTTDFFAAGMQDNGLATILGVDPVTGAGGANVWNHSTLSYFVEQSGGTDVQAMSSNIDIDIATRRSTRVGPNQGLPLEGLGVLADYTYQLTRRDVLVNNEGLIQFASQLLSSKDL